MSRIEGLVKSIERLLVRLKDLDPGYPLGDNRVAPVQSSSTIHEGLLLAQAGDLDDLADFYSSCDGVSLPDVHVGYFIKSVAILGTVDPSSEPIQIKCGDLSAPVLSFGSTGGGGLFVLRRTLRDVLHLAPGPLEDGIYDGDFGDVKVISTSFCGFLECLLADVRAFVNSDKRHRFIC